MTAEIRCVEQTAGEASGDRQLLEEIYADSLDAVIVHDAFPRHALDHVVECFRTGDPTADWNRPNKPIPDIDLRLLGVGAAPTATTPQGPSVRAYFDAAERTPAAIRGLFGEFDPFSAVTAALARVAGKPAETPVADHGAFSPCTVRAIPAGAGLMLHHDDHFRLPIYRDLEPQLDASLLVSFFVVLQRPESGGRLCVYALGPEHDGDLPRLDNGMLDPVAFHERVPHQYYDLAEGDMFIFGSGRLYHTVERVQGTRSRVTIGGFLGFDTNHERCMYWS